MRKATPRQTVVDLVCFLVIFPVISFGVTVKIIDAYCQTCQSDGKILLTMLTAITVYLVLYTVLTLWRARQDIF